ncbi:hypothetical protein HHI36_020438 [Cryptolaemus montrouzieri]|uniref:Uncharacterized protein n=1 Tax=Cryptolaemus montrouzieri TaxID=559131 RepID=A0ABD2NAH9_9CUCU
MTKALKRPFREIPSFIENDVKYVMDADKANKLASNFESIHTLPDVETDEQTDVTLQVEEFYVHTITTLMISKNNHESERISTDHKTFA